MKKVLYISNIEVPYRVKFFNELSKYCDLTVVYEREKSSNRDKNWTQSESGNFKVEYLGGIKISRENSFSLKIFKYIFGSYDSIILGCYNSPVIMLAIIFMRFFRRSYILNVDGEIFLDNSFKGKVKKFFLKGAEKYLCAGVKSAESLESAVNGGIYPYYFSSLTLDELESNAQKKCKRNNTVLVVGQYFDYKGMDIALKTALMDSSISYKFVGMGNRTKLFIEENASGDIPNVEFIPFLQKAELEKEYQSCAMVVLPSRKECWGLVINEAASFGTPVVSTWGSGAAVEFLSDEYSEFLAKPDDAEGIYQCIKSLLKSKNEPYSNFLKEKSYSYSIERNVQEHLKVLNIN